MNETNLDPNVAGAGLAGFLVIFAQLLKTYVPMNTKYLPLIMLVVGTPLQMLAQHHTLAVPDPFLWIGAFMWATTATGIHQTLKQSSEAITKKNMMWLWVLCLIPLLSVGCARFGTQQTDVSFNTDGSKLREVTTDTRASTLFASKAKLAELETLNTDASQKTKVGQAELITEEKLSDFVGQVVDGLKAYLSAGTSAVLDGIVDGASSDGSSVTISREDLEELLNALKDAQADGEGGE